MTATQTATSTVGLELLDLQSRLTSMAANAGAEAAMFVGQPEFAYHHARVEAFHEAAQVVAHRIAELTRRQS